MELRMCFINPPGPQILRTGIRLDPQLRARTACCNCSFRSLRTLQNSSVWVLRIDRVRLPSRTASEGILPRRSRFSGKPAIEIERNQTMRELVLIIVCSLALLPARLTAADELSRQPAWKLVWHDEFNGRALDGKKWNVLTRE